jgi:hypothetical protein
MQCQIEEYDCSEKKGLISDEFVAFQYERIIRDLRSELNGYLSGKKDLTLNEEKTLRKELNTAIAMYNRYC